MMNLAEIVIIFVGICMVIFIVGFFSHILWKYLLWPETIKPAMRVWKGMEKKSTIWQRTYIFSLFIAALTILALVAKLSSALPFHMLSKQACGCDGEKDFNLYYEEGIHSEGICYCEEGEKHLRVKNLGKEDLSIKGWWYRLNHDGQDMPVASSDIRYITYENSGGIKYE